MTNHCETGVNSSDRLLLSAQDSRRKSPGKPRGPTKKSSRFCGLHARRTGWNGSLTNLRVRCCVPKEHLHFLPSGTSSNEALHSEINAWSRSTNTLHRSTLALKLRYYHYIKLMAHHLATHFPLTHIVSESVLLSRATRTSIWTDEEWKQWCSAQHSLGKQQKARLPLAATREQETVLVRNWVAKRPAGNSRKQRKVKRTPLTTPRRHTLRSAGVKTKFQ